MSFKFNLESVLKYRKRLEDIAQKEYAEAQANVDECLNKIEGMYKRLDEVREEVSQAQKSKDGRNIAEILEMEHFMAGHKIRIEAMRQAARVLLQIAEVKQEALITAAREKKMLIKLKEKKKIEYHEWLRTVETKEQDDMTMARQAWGKK